MSVVTTTMTTGVIELSIDGRPVLVPSGSTILDAARGLGIDIPVLCHAQEQTPIGVCRVCTVEVKGARVFAAACVRTVEPGMEVHTATDRVLRARRTLYEMLLSDHPAPCLRQQTTQDCELETQAARAGVTTPRFAPHPSPRGVDDSSPIIRVERSACRFDSWEEWCRQVIWYGNKKGAYLYTQQVAEPQLAGHF